MIPDTTVIWRDLGDIPQATLYAIADVHLGAEESDVEAFTDLLDAIKGDPAAYIVLHGDLIDNGLKSSVTNVYRQVMRPSEQKREMARMLAPVRDKIICILPGNHEGRSSKESDDCPAYDIASKLDIEDIYRENMAVIRYSIGKDTLHQRPYTYTMAVVHGSGGGMYLGGTVNKNDNFIQSLDGIDMLLSAHVHKPYAHRGSKLVYDGTRRMMVQRPYLVMGAGSWLRYGGYAPRKQLRPVAMPGTDYVRVYGDQYRFEGVV
jgi:UDP-2,3-diacylglucosamine pyrophosphatase LpxH